MFNIVEGIVKLRVEGKGYVADKPSPDRSQPLPAPLTWLAAPHFPHSILGIDRTFLPVRLCRESMPTWAEMLPQRPEG
jgi:hypothetical protein